MFSLAQIVYDGQFMPQSGSMSSAHGHNKIPIVRAAQHPDSIGSANMEQQSDAKAQCRKPCEDSDMNMWRHHPSHGEWVQGTECMVSWPEMHVIVANVSSRLRAGGATCSAISGEPYEL